MQINNKYIKNWSWLLFQFFAFTCITDFKAQTWPNIDSNPDVLIINDPNSIQSENSVFISPLNKNIVLNSNNSHAWNGSSQAGAYGVSNFSSINGGVNWSGTVNNLGGLADPCVVIGNKVIGNNERFYVSYINSSGGQDISYSDDYGSTWTTQNIAPNPGTPGDLLDKGHLWIDNSSASPYFGYLYAGWTPIYSGIKKLQIETSRSTNNGQNWSTGQIISTGPGMNPTTNTYHTGVNFQTGRNGEVYACWAIADGGGGSKETAIGFNSSNNGGASWQVPKRIQTIINGESYMALGNGKSMRINSFPSMAVNKQTGEIFVVWSEFAVPNLDADIFMIKSSNGGITWSSRTRVNQDLPQSTAIDQWFPWIACDEISGALVVLYYDCRNSLNTQVETFTSISYDNGSTWQDYVVSDGNFWDGDKIPGFGIGNKGNYAGDYIGLDAYHGKVVPIWSDSRAGSSYMQAFTHPFEIPCPNNLTLCDAVIEGNSTLPGEAAYNVNNIITAGGSSCNYLIKNTGNAIMQAGTEIQLRDGFSALGEFQGKIVSCSSFSQRLSNEVNPPNNASSNNISLLSKPKKEISFDDFSLFPNPNNGNFKLTLNNSNGFPTKIVIEDLVGKSLIWLNNPSSYSYDLSLQDFPSGMFVVKVIYSDRIIAKKVIKN